MATVVNRYIGSNGDVLIPLSFDSNNVGDLLSVNGTYYKVQTTEIVAIEAGNPIGLLLTLTYSATP